MIHFVGNKIVEFGTSRNLHTVVKLVISVTPCLRLRGKLHCDLGSDEEVVLSDLN